MPLETLLHSMASARQHSESLLTRGRDGGIGGVIAGQSMYGALSQSRLLNNGPSVDAEKHYSGWTYACIRVTAQRVAGQEIMVARKIKGPSSTKSKKILQHLVPKNMQNRIGNLEVIESHPLIDALRVPNQLQLQNDLIFVMVAGLELTARSYLWVRDDDGNGTKDIWPIPAHWMTPVYGSDKIHNAWVIRPDNSTESFTVPAEQIIYSAYPNPNSPIRPISPLQAAARPVLIDEQIQECQRRSFRSPHPAMAVHIASMPDQIGLKGSKPELAPEQKARIEGMIMQMYSGALNYDKPIILDGWIEKLEFLSKTVKEMDYNNSAKAIKDRITQMLQTNPISLGHVEGANRACHDDQTQLLTRRGWLNYNEIGLDDVAGTMNPATGRFEWQKIDHIHIYPDYDGEMVRLKSLKIDVMVTPDHRMWKTRHIQPWKKVDGRQLVRKDLPWGFSPASDMKRRDAIPIGSKPQEADIQSWFEIPGMQDRGGTCGKAVLPPRRMPMNPFLAFLGWWISEGWILTSRKSTRQAYSIGIKQAVGAEKECQAIAECVGSLDGINVSRSTQRPKLASETSDGYARQSTHTWLMNDKRLWNWLRLNCGTKSRNKRLPDFVFDLPGAQLNLLLDAMLLGDGHHRSEESAVYFTNSPELADQVQTLALLCGRTARRCKTMSNGVIPVTVTSYCNTMEMLPKHIGRENYKGTVWCVTVPNGLIFTRRNGKTLISGNSALSADQNFLSINVNPKIEMLSSIFTYKLAPMYADDNEELVVWIVPAITSDREADLQESKVLRETACLTTNEFRHKLGYSPLDGPIGEMVLVPNLYVLQDPSKEPIPPVDPNAQTGNDSESDAKVDADQGTEEGKE